jgi:two-component system, NarL family, sensor kinase
MRRVPIESSGPIVMFAIARLAVALVALTAVAVVGFPYDGRAAAVLVVFVAWSAAMLAVAQRAPDRVTNPLVACGDFALLLALELAAPDTLGAVRLTALFLIAAHAHFQGERRGLAVAAVGSVVLVVGSALRGDAPFDSDLLAFYEAVFVLSALATAVVVGLLRTSESASRLRARGLSRRTMQAESEVRRRVAESIHDGPVQEMIGLDMILSAARNAADNGRGEEATGLIDEARELGMRNLRALRDEIVDLGPYAFQEISFETAIEDCLPVWRRRYGFEVGLAIERIDLPPEMAGDLFRIAQEAVVNAGRHAEANAVSISLRMVGPRVELRVADDGHGFNDNGPGGGQPGHLGLASMRERAELMDGTLEIESSERGTRVLVLAPLPAPTTSRPRAAPAAP